ncbi:aminotransferase class I/II-fold pyridoxal phosphate-dependent enzyme [Bacillus haynesii]|uniref:aminotransferase class I/II-fold pyridoxal phosphate-dependent enzyme n=1 Tax=Bacillus haynesii TaxID=1925021 RepID=UPI0039908093
MRTSRKSYTKTKSTYLRDGIQQIGLNVLHSESPIIPIILPDRDTTLRFADSLQQEGATLTQFSSSHTCF